MLRVHGARSALPLAAVMLVLMAACGGGGGGTDPGEDDLVVVAFSHSGRTDVYRNQPVTLTFNVAVDASTVNDRTIEIRTGPNLKTAARGRYHVDGNRVTFDPRESEVALRDRRVIGPNPFGFEALSGYQVLVVGPPDAKRLASLAGKQIRQEFFTTFQTTAEFMPELVQPRYVGEPYEGEQAGFAEAYGTGDVDIRISADVSRWHESEDAGTGVGHYDLVGYIRNLSTDELIRYDSFDVELDAADPSGKTFLSTLRVAASGRDIHWDSGQSMGSGTPGTASQMALETSKSGLAFLQPQNPDRPVAQDSLIVLVFDEPIDPASMDPGSTVIVRNETLTQQLGNEVKVPGTFSFDSSATRWTFEPSGGIGQGPYDLTVTFLPGIRDLAGNPLGNPTVVWFRSEFTPSVPNRNFLIEEFKNTSKRDFANTTADWSGGRPDWLQGGAITTNVIEVQLLPTQPGLGGGSRTRLASPLTSIADGSHTQMLYMQKELGDAGAITQVGWGPDSNALFAATHDRLILKLGHYSNENLTRFYGDNFNVGTPVRVYDGEYVIPQKANINPPGLEDGYWPFPPLTSFFEYDGQSNLVLDVDVTAGTNFQIHRVFYGLSFSNPTVSVIPNRRLYGPFGAEVGPPPVAQPPGNPEPTVYDISFTKRRRTTVAQSTWYDSFVNNANYGTPILSPPTQPGGATFDLQFEGAKGMPHPTIPGYTIPDPATQTGFVDNIDILDGYRYIRFRFTLYANLISNTVPEINSLTIPYIF